MRRAERSWSCLHELQNAARRGAWRRTGWPSLECTSSLPVTPSAAGALAGRTRAPDPDHPKAVVTPLDSDSPTQPRVQDLHQVGHVRMFEEPDVRVRHSQDLEWLHRGRAPLLLGVRVEGALLVGGEEEHRAR